MDFLQIMNQLKQNPEILEKLANSADGQNLLSRLEPSRLEAAVQQGQSGDYREMAVLLKGVMNSPDGKALLQRMAQQLGK